MRQRKTIGGTGTSCSDRVKGSRVTIIRIDSMHRSGIGDWGCHCIIGQTWYGIFEKALQAVPLAVGIRCCLVRIR